MKVMTIVGTRPEIIRLSEVIKKMDQAFNHVLVHTGQNYDFELNQIFFKDLGLENPKHYLEAAGANATHTIGNIIIKIDEILDKEKPDAVLLLGDTNSCLAAIPAKKRKIPIFHMEAGNRCFDMRVPEEVNRRIVDHVADINLTYSTIAREYLLKEGLPADRVIKTGSPMKEVILSHMDKIKKSEVLKNLSLKENQYFVLSAHREENIEQETHFNNLVKVIKSLTETYKLPIIFSVHPRTKKKIEEKGIDFGPLVKLLKPLGFTDYISLQLNSLAVLSDSGTITEESSILNFPALNIRDTHERPEGFEEASVMFTGLSPERVMQGLEILKTQKTSERKFKEVADYDVENVSDKVVRIILSYTDYVNRYVWRKNV